MLTSLPMLTRLDLSNNRLDKFLSFTEEDDVHLKDRITPLVYANYSNNAITQFSRRLSGVPFLTEIDLSGKVYK